MAVEVIDKAEYGTRKRKFKAVWSSSMCVAMALCAGTLHTWVPFSLLLGYF